MALHSRGNPWPPLPDGDQQDLRKSSCRASALLVSWILGRLGRLCRGPGKRHRVLPRSLSVPWKREWDLVRSARLVVDVGIHYEGWTRDQALRWWNENIPNQADISEREVNRITCWPAQAVSYKAGEDEIVNLRKMAAEKQGSDFNLRRFHTILLQRGSSPLPLLREIVVESQKMK